MDAAAQLTAVALISEAMSETGESLEGLPSLVEHALELQAEEAELDFTMLPNWNATAVSTWPLQYRSDERNWRNWAHNN